jgi:hypothetical protein
VLLVGLVLSFSVSADAASRFSPMHKAKHSADKDASAEKDLKPIHRAYRFIRAGRAGALQVGRISWDGARHKGDLSRQKDGPKMAKYDRRNDKIDKADGKAQVVTRRRIRGRYTHNPLAKYTGRKTTGELGTHMTHRRKRSKSSRVR